jgi:hypothetical protein
MTGKQRYTPEQVSEALSRAHGLQHTAAGALHCSASTVRRYIKRYPEVRETYQQVKGLFVDRAELQLMEAVDQGEWPAVRFTLLTLGKERGYVLGGDARPVIEDDDAMEEFEAALLKAFGSEAGEDDLDDDLDAEAGDEEERHAMDGETEDWEER